MRPKVLSVLAAITGLFLGGCSTLPTSGEAQVFEFETPHHQPVHQYGAAPREGSEPTRLVEDFLRTASAGVYDDYATMRLYLTPSASLYWSPSQRVVIFATEDAPDIHLVENEDEDVVNVAVTVVTVGTLDDTRVLEESPKEGLATLNFGLQKNGEGEWRINELEDGIILSKSAFDTSFQQLDLLFPSQDGSALVPDPRWYARTPKQTTQMTQDLIDGPAPSVAPATGPQLQSGWTLPQRGVEIADGTAKVSLVTPEEQSAQDRLLVTWSLHKTLKQSPGVSNVEVDMNSVPQPSDDLPLGPDYVMDQVVGVVDGSVVAGPMGDLRAVLPPTVLTADPRLPVRGPTIPGPLAWIDGEQMVSVLGQRGADLTEFEFENPSAMSADRFGNIWLVAGDEDDRALHRIGADSSNSQVPLPAELSGIPVLLKVSSDGARVGLLTSSPTGSGLWVGALTREGDKGQFSLENLEIDDRADPKIVDFTWNDSTRLDVLIGDPVEGDMSVQSLQIGGWASTISAPAGAERITASRTGSSALLQRTDGLIYKRSGASWFEVGDQPSCVSFPG